MKVQDIFGSLLFNRITIGYRTTLRRVNPPNAVGAGTEVRLMLTFTRHKSNCIRVLIAVRAIPCVEALKITAHVICSGSQDNGRLAICVTDAYTPQLTSSPCEKSAIFIKGITKVNKPRWHKKVRAYNKSR